MLALRGVQLPTHPPRRVGGHRLRRAVVPTVRDRVVVAVLVVLALPGVVLLYADALPGTPVIGLGLLVPGALLVGARRLDRPVGGPDIHDRQLDRIVAGLAAGAAGGFVAAGAAGVPGTLATAVLLTPGLLAAAVTTLGWGARRAWQLRAVPLLLLAAVPAPWAAVVAPAVAAGGTGTVSALGVLAAAAVVALLARPGPRPPVRRHARPATSGPVVLPVRTVRTAVAVGEPVRRAA